MTFFSPNHSVRLFETTIVGLASVVVVVFLGFLAVSIPLAAISLEMRNHLGYSSATIGWVIGIQSIATLLTRHQSGTLCDQRGARFVVLMGLPLAATSGVAYLVSGKLIGNNPAVGLSFMVLGRLLLGLGESLFLTGLMSWGITRLGAAHTGKVMSWTGIAIYAALGLGAPVGLVLQARFGFGGVGIATVLTPLIAFGIAVSLPPVAPAGGGRVPFHRVLALNWRPGLVLALATVPFAAMVAFPALAFAERRWPQAGTALFGFAAAYVLVRLIASGLPDRFGAARITIGSLAFEALGQSLLWWLRYQT